jgi:hypothetical protein
MREYGIHGKGAFDIYAQMKVVARDKSRTDVRAHLALMAEEIRSMRVQGHAQKEARAERTAAKRAEAAVKKAAKAAAAAAKKAKKS